ncbi:hypothetical protein ACFL0Z_03555 [Patescibacteria group bacterium]
MPESEKEFTPPNDSSPQEDEIKKIVGDVVKKAQEEAREKGLEIGQVLAHPDDDYTYELKEIEGDTAVVWFPDQDETIKRFPLNELFDPNTAKDMGFRKGFKSEYRKRLGSDN